EEVIAGIGRLDVEVELQHQSGGEEDRVIQERLGDHQCRTEYRTTRIELEQHLHQVQVPDSPGRPDLQLLGTVDRGQRAFGVRDVVLDLVDRFLGLLLVAVHDLPARALRQVAPYVDDHQGEHRTDQVGDPPAGADRQVVEHPQGDRRAD